MYLWPRIKERLKYREGKEAKERSAKRLLPRPQHEPTRLEAEKWNV